jgi:hypothetical protein
MRLNIYLNMMICILKKGPIFVVVVVVMLLFLNNKTKLAKF